MNERPDGREGEPPEDAGTPAFKMLPPDDALLTDDEVATVLGVRSTSTIHRWAAAGDLAFIRGVGKGRRRLFLGSDIRAFVFSRRQERQTLAQRVAATLGGGRRRRIDRPRPRPSATGRRGQGRP